LRRPWIRLALEAGAACTHREGDRTLCPDCAARAIELAVDVLTRGRVADAGPGEGNMESEERIARIGEAIGALSAQVVAEDTRDAGLRVLREEWPALVEELRELRRDSARQDARVNDLLRQLENTRRCLRGVGALAETIGGNKAEAIAGFSKAFAEGEPTVGEPPLCASCRAFGPCLQSDDPRRSACNRYEPAPVEEAPRG
jgi:hypothetical protein